MSRPGTFEKGIDQRRGRGPHKGAPNAGRPLKAENPGLRCPSCWTMKRQILRLPKEWGLGWVYCCNACYETFDALLNGVTVSALNRARVFLPHVDCCKKCREADFAVYGDFVRYKAQEAEVAHRGYVAAYRCSQGHKWQTSWGTSTRLHYDQLESELFRGVLSKKPFSPQGSSNMRDYVKLYLDEDRHAIGTNIIDERLFLERVSETFAGMIHDKRLNGDSQYHLSRWLPQVVDIVCKLRGYKAPTVEEQRVLIAGAISPSETMVVASTEREAVAGVAESE